MLTSLQRRRELLAETPVFAQASHEFLTKLAGRASRVFLAQNQSLFLKGDPSRCLYVVESGLIRIGTMSREGREVSHYVLGRGAVVGEVEALDGGDRPDDAKAVEPSQLLAFERGEILGLIEQHPAHAVKILHLLCQRIRRAEEQLDDRVLLSLTSRLAKHLLSLVQMAESEEVRTGPPEVRLSQQALAENLGITRESVNKVLSRWEQAGIVTLSRGRITLNRVAHLRDIAAPRPHKDPRPTPTPFKVVSR